MKFNTQKTYLILALIIFILEVFIATLFKNTILRPVFGDFLVVILIYALVKGLFNFKALQLSVGVLLFAYLVEILQMINITQLLGFNRSTFLDLTIGHSFDWNDMIAYTLGVFLIFVMDKFKLIPVKNQVTSKA